MLQPKAFGYLNSVATELMWALTEVNRRVSHTEQFKRWGKGWRETLVGACALVHTCTPAVSDE